MSIESSSVGPARARRAWCLYDWANSAFATTIMAAVLPTYFARVAAAGLPAHQATAIWGYLTSALLVVAAIGAPLLGAFVAAHRAQRVSLAIAVAIGAPATAALALAGAGEWRLVLVAYAVAFLAFCASSVVYDGLLVSVASPEERDRVSARGFAWGYAGGGLLLAIHVAWLTQPSVFGFSDVGSASRMAFATAGAWWGVFALPLLLTPLAIAGAGRLPTVTESAWARLRAAVRDRALLRPAWTFLIAFWLYNDAVGTVVKMAAIYGASLGLGTPHLVGALLMVQIIAIPATLGAGVLAQAVGTRNCLFGAIAVYVGIALLGFFLERPIHFWIIAGLAGLAQGGVQALSRSYFSGLVPAERATEMFGFYNLSSRIGGVVGTFCFAAIAQATGSARFGSLSLLPLLLGGALVLALVRDGKSRPNEVAGAAQT